MSYSYRKSNVAGGSWSTPFNTPFFIRYGESSIKVPMVKLLLEYEIWEKLRGPSNSDQGPRAPSEASFADDPFASSGPIDWAEEVEQELFFDDGASDSKDSEPVAEEFDDSDDDEVLMIVPIEDLRFSGRGPAYALYTILEVDEVVDDQCEAQETESDDADDTDSTSTISTDSAYSTDSTTSTDFDLSAFRLDNINSADSGSSVDTVRVEDPGSVSGNLFHGAIQHLSVMALLKLDAYIRFIQIAAQISLNRFPFWLNSPFNRDRGLF
ncbi:hypothetical protein BD311DRAFT_837200 [Dichomitus squalens]|uniref:Uncharacterized protein n=1 Tax=Dichomitus squalens TaxID=114155 RepID=A0A4Q9MS89_9APHY|nr:hypothetical protein BD311DRAFT_837200 [Dichomitus squalens]